MRDGLRIEDAPLGSPSRTGKVDFARDLQESLSILALFALSAPFRICNLQIPLARRETDPRLWPPHSKILSGNHRIRVLVARTIREHRSGDVRCVAFFLLRLLLVHLVPDHLSCGSSGSSLGDVGVPAWGNAHAVVNWLHKFIRLNGSPCLSPASSCRRCAHRQHADPSLWDGQRYAVRERAGPWRVSGQWWSEANWVPGGVVLEIMLCSALVANR
jgi:hypothetical protein